MMRPVIFWRAMRIIADGRERVSQHRVPGQEAVRGEWTWLRCREKMLRDKDGQP